MVFYIIHVTILFQKISRRKSTILPGSIYGRGLRDIFPHFRDFSVYDLEEDGLDLPFQVVEITGELTYSGSTPILVLGLADIS